MGISIYIAHDTEMQNLHDYEILSKNSGCVIALLAYLLAVHRCFVSRIIPLWPECICCPAEDSVFWAAIGVTCNRYIQEIKKPL